MQIDVLVPSRGRPQNLERLARAIAATADTPVRIRVRLDSDDPSRDGYPELDNVSYTTGPRVHFAASVNELAAESDATHFAILGDDVLPETLGWDTALLASLGDGIGVAYGSDGLELLHGPDLPTHVLVPRAIFDRLGWIALPALRHLFCDNVWRDLGNAVDNLVYSPNVKLTHLHRWNKTAPDDDTYREANDKAKRLHDRRAYVNWRHGDGYRHAVQKLRGTS